MFTDGPTTPRRVEVLLEMLAWLGREGNKKLKRSTLIESMQPSSLPGVPTERDQAKATLKAASELGFMDARGDSVEITFDISSSKPSRELLLDALDQQVLAKTDVEKHFALFYSYLLGLGPEAVRQNRGQLVDGFQMRVFGEDRVDNPFNPTKLDGLRRWMRYAGLGWNDSKDTFHAVPYDRIKRNLESLFARKHKLDSDEFMERLADVCPELDGGRIYRRANTSADVKQRVATLGVSQALLALHDDEFIRLHGYPDSRGWNLGIAEPSPDNKTLKSDRIEGIELVRKPQEARRG